MFKQFVAFLGRFFLSVVFIASATAKIIDWQETHQALFQGLTDLAMYTLDIPWAQQLIEMALPLTSTLLVVAVGLELVGGLCLLLGVQVRLGAFVLALFLIPTTVVMHPFWFLQDPDRSLQTAMFLKNVSILGGLLTVLAFGRGGSCKKGSDKSSDAPKKA